MVKGITLLTILGETKIPGDGEERQETVVDAGLLNVRSLVPRQLPQMFHLTLFLR